MSIAYEFNILKTYFFRILYRRLFKSDILLCWKSLFKSNTKDTTTTDKTTDCKEPSPNNNQNYQDLNPNTIYQELNPNTNYQELKLPYVDENEYQNTTIWEHKMCFECVLLWLDNYAAHMSDAYKHIDIWQSRLLILIFRGFFIAIEKTFTLFIVIIFENDYLKC